MTLRPVREQPDCYKDRKYTDNELPMNPAMIFAIDSGGMFDTCRSSSSSPPTC